jgi:hypothetical protein
MSFSHAASSLILVGILVGILADESAGPRSPTAHSPREWRFSEWPVCPVTDMAAPHRIGAALTYARRYALFTLVGIAGEDDLDAPDLDGGQQPPSFGAGNGSKRVPEAASPHRPQGNGKRPRPPMLDAKSSAVLRDRLVGEIASIPSAEHGAEWAYQALPAKNTLTASDARLVQLAFELRLSALNKVTHSPHRRRRRRKPPLPLSRPIEHWPPPGPVEARARVLVGIEVSRPASTRACCRSEKRDGIGTRRTSNSSPRSPA